MHNCSFIGQQRNSLLFIFNECWLKCLQKYNLDISSTIDIRGNNFVTIRENIMNNFNYIKAEKNFNVLKSSKININGLNFLNDDVLKILRNNFSMEIYKIILKQETEITIKRSAATKLVINHFFWHFSK